MPDPTSPSHNRRGSLSGRSIRSNAARGKNATHDGSMSPRGMTGGQSSRPRSRSRASDSYSDDDDYPLDHVADGYNLRSGTPPGVKVQRISTRNNSLDLSTSDEDRGSDSSIHNFDGSATDSTFDTESNLRNGSVGSSSSHNHSTLQPPLIRSNSARNSIRKSRGYLENPFAGQDGRTIVARNDFSEHMSDARSIVSASDSDLYSREAGHNTSGIIVGRTSTINSALSRHPSGRQSLHGPAHPYNMYPQNVEPDTIDDTASQADPNQNIPMGFPTTLRVSNFRNDPDNRSEQLPPYTEYPEGPGARPPVAADRESVASSQHLNPFMSPSENPFMTSAEPQSMSDNVQTPTAAEDDNDNQVAAANKEWHEKTWKEKSWSERRRTKLCGLKFGWLIVASGIVMFFVIVASATVGGYFGARSRAPVDDDGTGSYKNIDSSPIEGKVQALPTGTFQLQLGFEQEVQAECLINKTQAPSWNCSIFSRGGMGISIYTTPQGAQLANISNINGDAVGYGADIPRTVQAPLRLVRDIDAPGWGAAYQFQAVYTKVVNVPEAALAMPAPGSTAMSKRGYPNRWSTSDKEAIVRQRERVVSTNAKPGERIWQCNWNYTLIEGFIYIKKNSTSWYNTPGPDVLASTTSPASSPTSTSGSAASASSTSTTCQWQDGTIYGTPTSFLDPCPPVRGLDVWSSLAFFPQVIKIEERRLAGDQSQPYCNLKQVLDNGSLGDVIDPVTHKAFVLPIGESSPDLSSWTSYYPENARPVKRGGSTLPPLRKRALVDGACHCQWISGDFTPLT